MNKKTIGPWVKSVNTKKVHQAWHSFCEYMKKWYFESYQPTTYNKKTDKFTTSERKFKAFSSKDMQGYVAMTRVENYAKTHPEIQIVRCDDSVFSSSMIVLIPHPTMGITMIYIPQNNKEIKGELFLYPDHSEELIEKLTIMRKKCLKGDKIYSSLKQLKEKRKS